MEIKAKKVISIFQESIADWHQKKLLATDTLTRNYPENSPEFLLYKKNWIDTEQWHIEDEIRRADISDHELVGFKRKIDKLNQERTDSVELLDNLIFNLYKDTKKQPEAKMNSETPAWLIDRMSILELKIYHMEEQTHRTDVSGNHIDSCQTKLNILLEQRKDLGVCLDEMLDDLAAGKKYFKVYRQMKMYNDETLNPSLYSSKNDPLQSPNQSK